MTVHAPVTINGADLSNAVGVKSAVTQALTEAFTTVTALMAQRGT